MAKTMHPDAKLDLDAIKRALNALESPRDRKARERAAVFAQLYELIRDKLNCGVSKRQILDLLAEFDLVLTYDQFAELLIAEAMHRGEPVPGKETDMPAQDVSVDESMLAPQAGVTKQEAE